VRHRRYVLPSMRGVACDIVCISLRISEISCIIGKLVPILVERKAGGGEINPPLPKIEEILIYEQFLCMFDPKLGMIG
jgi:hypothetical protein